MKRATTHLFKRQNKNRAFFQNYRTFTLIQDPPGANPRGRQRSETRPQGQLECANPPGSPGGMVRLGID